MIDRVGSGIVRGFDASMSVAWIFHVTDASNRSSIEQRGLVLDVKGSGQGGRDSVHFMYRNGNSPGYIRMADGTTPPRHHSQPIYCVLLPGFAKYQQLFLSKNGVILVYGDVAAAHLRKVEQLPTISMNILRRGRGHMLPTSVTGGT